MFLVLDVSEFEKINGRKNKEKKMWRFYLYDLTVVHKLKKKKKKVFGKQ